MKLVDFVPELVLHDLDNFFVVAFLELKQLLLYNFIELGLIPLRSGLIDHPALGILLLKSLLQVLRVPLLMKFYLFDVQFVPVVKLLNFSFVLPFLLLFVQTPLLLYLFISVLLPPPQDRLF